MIDTMLGPPPAATGSTDGARLPTDGTRGPRAPHRSDREFSSELHDAATRREPSRTDETHTKDAAGPAEGKLHKTRSDAEAAGSETPEHDGRDRSSEPGDPAESTTEGADATVTDATRSALAAATAEAAATVTTAAAPAEPVADGASAPLTTALETAAPVATAGADGAQASDVAAAGQPLPQGTGAPATAAATTTATSATATATTTTTACEHVFGEQAQRESCHGEHEPSTQPLEHGEPPREVRWPLHARHTLTNRTARGLSGWRR